MKNQNKNLLTFLFGAAVGAAVAWLFTSEEGKKIVAETKDKAKQWTSEMKEKLDSDASNTKSVS